MKKGYLEQALELIPSGTNFFPDLKDLDETYKALRIVENAYEQLKSDGCEVDAQLKERRYQIAELICRVLSTDVNNVKSAISNRDVDEQVIVDFYSNLQANTYIPKLTEILGRIVPDMGKAIREGAQKIEDCFPEPK